MTVSEYVDKLGPTCYPEKFADAIENAINCANNVLDALEELYDNATTGFFGGNIRAALNDAVDELIELGRLSLSANSLDDVYMAVDDYTQAALSILSDAQKRGFGLYEKQAFEVLSTVASVVSDAYQTFSAEEEAEAENCPDDDEDGVGA